MKNLMKQEAGFTLLELIVVVAVIGILAAIIVPQVSDIQGDAQLSSVKSSLSSIQTALEQYKLEGDGTYPSATETASDYIEDELGIDLTGYSYATDGDNEQYIVAYEGDSDATVSISPVSISDIDSEDKLDGVYYVTSESTALLTTN